MKGDLARLGVLSVLKENMESCLLGIRLLLPSSFFTPPTVGSGSFLTLSLLRIGAVSIDSWKKSVAWRLIVDPSIVNRYLLSPRFQMETRRVKVGMCTT